MSWPVANSLMIEPTESEPKQELDRFCEALLQIREEIEQIIQNNTDKRDTVLKNAPHPAHEAIMDEWSHSYSPKQAVYPTGVYNSKFWPPVARIDNTYGDRNLVCCG